MAPPVRFVSIGTRLVAATTLLLTVVALLVYAGLSRYERRSLLRAKETAAQMVVSLFAATAQAPVIFEDKGGVDDALAGLGQNPDVTFAGVYAPSKNAPDKLDEAMRFLARGDVPEPGDLSSIPPLTRTRWAADHLVLVSRIPDPKGGKAVGAVCVIFSLARENAAIAQVEGAILRDSFGVAFVTAALLVVFARRAIVFPLRRVADAAKQLERGEKVEIDVWSADEIGVLASGFRAMAEAIAQREAKIKARNADMRLVLDNLEQGLITLKRDGSISEERSATVDRWFGSPAPGTPIWTYLGSVDATFSEVLRVSWDALTDGIMPTELCLHQMPRRMRSCDRTYELAYRPVMADAVMADEEWSKLVLVISDITDRLEAERAEESQRETVAMFQRILRDPRGFSSFYDECAQLVATAKDATVPLVVVKRALHTLKGNSALFGLGSVARVCHDIETRIEESPSHPSPEESAAIADVWGAVEKRYDTLGRLGRKQVTIEESEYEALVEATRRGNGTESLARMVASFRSESVVLSLERFTERVHGLAAKLKRADVDVVVEPSRLRLPPNRFGPFWSAFTHVVRNAVDHGIETAAEREAAGKPPRATLRMHGYAAPEAMFVVIHDDGRGIDWEAVAAKARAHKLPASTHDDLVNALFADAFSTRDVVTETSGRGMGLSVVREVVRGMGGRIEVESNTGKGSLFRFVFPLDCLESLDIESRTNAGTTVVARKLLS